MPRTENIARSDPTARHGLPFLASRRSWLPIACLISTLLPFTFAEAETPSHAAERYWSFQLENDFLADAGDRYYTNGFQVSHLRMGRPPSWLERLAAFFPAFRSDGSIVGTQYTVGQQIFTPDDTQAVEVIPDDRPYAGYLYFSTNLLARVQHARRRDTGNLLELTLGIVGPASLAEQSQTWFHELFGNDVPQGWHNQLANEPALGISYSRFWRNIQPVAGHLEMGLNPQVTASIGNVHTYGAAGVMWRLGTHLNHDLSPPNIRPGFPGFAYFAIDRGFSWYVFAGIEGRLVLRNIFLDGNSFTDSHSVTKEPLVGDLQFGVVLRFGKMRVALSNMQRSREFTTQSQPTRYGALNLSIAL